MQRGDNVPGRLEPVLFVPGGRGTANLPLTLPAVPVPIPVLVLVLVRGGDDDDMAVGRLLSTSLTGVGSPQSLRTRFINGKQLDQVGYEQAAWHEGVQDKADL